MYVLFAPFCGISDRLTLLSFHQARFALAYIFIGFFLLLGWRRGLKASGCFILFLVWVVLIEHPMARLVPTDPDTLLIDFHSHSNVSHDGRPSFTAERNMRWHEEQGYNASFITDHNRVENTQKAKAISRVNWRETGYRSLEGEEVSLWKTHLVILGNHARVDNRPFDTDSSKIEAFIKEMNRQKITVIASIPEYWWYHWDVGVSTGGTFHDFVTWGINGFEIVNSAPKALDFPPSYRARIVELCRQNNLFMTGISDNHGYGYATAVWNAMQIPGWHTMDPDQLEKAVLSTLKTKKFQAVEVLERTRYNPGTFLELLVAPLNDAGLYWRSLQPWEAVSWVAWIWVAFIVLRKRRSVK